MFWYTEFMVKAIWNNVVLAESDATVMLGRECYFPIASVRVEHLVKNGKTVFCAAKGYGDYYDVVGDGKTLVDGAWIYPHPYWEAEEVKGMVSFCGEVEISA